MLLNWIVLSQLHKFKSQIFISTQKHVVNVMSNYRKTVRYEFQAKSVVFFICTLSKLLHLDTTISSSSRMIVDDETISRGCISAKNVLNVAFTTLEL